MKFIVKPLFTAFCLVCVAFAIGIIFLESLSTIPTMEIAVPQVQNQLVVTPVPTVPPTPIPTIPRVVHRIEFGDNLYDLSIQYDTTIEAIKLKNGLKTDALSIGQELLIPVSSIE